MDPHVQRLPPTNGKPWPCSCSTWSSLNPFARDMVLGDIMEWASLLHQVQLKLMLRGEHVAICELLPLRVGTGRSRVLSDLLSWADCVLAVLELTPSEHFGSNAKRLVKYFSAHGFEPNREPSPPLVTSGAMIRYPTQLKCQLRF